MIYYVYAYINKKTGLPYYIGKGKNYRAYVKQHCISVPKDRSKIVFLETNLTEVGALALERRYIQWYGRKDIETGILRNKTNGGEGWTSSNFHSEEAKEKMRKPKPKGFSEKMKARKGEKRSEVAKKRISEAVKGIKKSRSLDHCVKISEHKKKYWENRLDKIEFVNNVFDNGQKYCCSHCNKYGIGPAMKRWHFDNCNERIK